MEKARAREKARELAYLKKQATQIVNKATPALAALDAILNRSDVDLVSKPLIEPIEEAQKFLQDAAAAASATLALENSDGDDWPEMPSVSDVAEKVASSKKDIALVTNMLAAISHRNR